MSLGSTSTWHCHICNSEVPMTHIQDHNESWEHEAYVSICQESLKRLNKHINPKQQITNNNKDNNSYFCNICSVIVNNDEKKSHLESKLHNKSKIYEKLLDNFLKVYVDVSFLKKTFCDEVKCDVTEMSHLYDSSVLKTNELTETHKGDQIDATKEQLQDSEKCNVDVKTIECKVVQHNELLSSIDDINKTIGNTEKADNPTKLCDICKVKISDKHWSEHENGKKHKQTLLKKKQKTLHYQMQISKCASAINCRICNTEVCEDTISIDTHLESPEHTTKYENLLKENSIVNNVNRLACITCGIYIGNKHEIRHIDSPNHKRVVNRKFSCYTIQDLETQESNVIYCKVCNIKISNKPIKMLNHLIDDMHTTGRSILMSSNNIKRFHILEGKRNFHYCDWCEKEFNAGTLHEHISSESHQIHIQKLVEYENDIIEHYMRVSKINKKLEKLECFICDDNESIYRCQRHVYWHMTSWGHESKHSNLLLKNKMEKINDNFHCNLCDVNIEAFQDLIHINSHSHKKNLLNFNKLLI